ncbi:MAG: hypothetical protein HC915_00855 [Anaerolineae bacterium]|nr:hypothetical protein [Anaerolineae bacterium]
MKVITVTLNPSFERTFVVQYLAVGYHNPARETTRLDPVGRGVNISRALFALNARTEAIVLLGTDATGIAYQALIEKEHFPVRLITASGQTRSNVVIWDAGNQTETVLSEDNAGFTAEEVHQVGERLVQAIEPGDYVVFAGPLPQGVSDQVYVQLIERSHSSGAEIVLDLPSEALHVTLMARPSIVFLTQVETEKYFNYPVRTPEDVAYCAQRLCQQGAQQALIMLSDNNGALLAAHTEVVLFRFPELEATGTQSGAIAAMIAGFLAGRLQEKPIKDAVHIGAAAAHYARQQIGNEFLASVDLSEYASEIIVEPVTLPD